MCYLGKKREPREVPASMLPPVPFMPCLPPECRPAQTISANPFTVEEALTQSMVDQAPIHRRRIRQNHVLPFAHSTVYLSSVALQMPCSLQPAGVVGSFPTPTHPVGLSSDIPYAGKPSSDLPTPQTMSSSMSHGVLNFPFCEHVNFNVHLSSLDIAI